MGVVRLDLYGRSDLMSSRLTVVKSSRQGPKAPFGWFASKIQAEVSIAVRHLKTAEMQCESDSDHDEDARLGLRPHEDDGSASADDHVVGC